MVVKGRAAVDSYCSMAAELHVYEAEKSDEVYDALLNQVRPSNLPRLYRRIACILSWTRNLHLALHATQSVPEIIARDKSALVLLASVARPPARMVQVACCRRPDAVHSDGYQQKLQQVLCHPTP
eukprot:scaffold75502_cov32-Tisochrysis_lutea.AAC.3